MAIKKSVRRVLKAFSVDHIDVEESRRTTNLKAISIAKNFHVKEDLVVQNHDYEVSVRVFFPDKESKSSFEANENELPVIIYLHGGGWVLGNVDGYERICDRIARYVHVVVISVEYRLAPEYRFPIGLTDCYAVVEAVANEAFPYAINTKDITLMGDSAGGNLTAVICQMARDRGVSMVRKQVLIYPAVNNDYSDHSIYNSVHMKGQDYILTSGQMRDFLTLYEGKIKDRENPYFAPILAEDFSDLPKALVVTCEHDPLRDEGEDYGARMKAAGNEVQIYRIPDAVHGYFGMGFNGPLVKETLYLIKRFLKEN